MATLLGAPLDALVVGKLAAPGDEAAAARDQAELVRRERAYRGQRPPPAVGGKVTILVDDGLATGATMRAAVAWARRNFAAKVVVAVPIGSRAAVDRLKDEADQVVCLAVLE